MANRGWLRRTYTYCSYTLEVAESFFFERASLQFPMLHTYTNTKNHRLVLNAVSWLLRYYSFTTRSFAKAEEKLQALQGWALTSADPSLTELGSWNVTGGKRRKNNSERQREKGVIRKGLSVEREDALCASLLLKLRVSARM